MVVLLKIHKSSTEDHRCQQEQADLAVLSMRTNKTFVPSGGGFEKSRSLKTTAVNSEQVEISRICLVKN